MAPGTNGQSKGKEKIGIFVYQRKKARMGQVDPNIVEIQHKEAYTIEDPQRRSPSLESPRTPPIIDEGDATQGHRVMDIAESKAAGVGTSRGRERMEERPEDTI